MSKTDGKQVALATAMKGTGKYAEEFMLTPGYNSLKIAKMSLGKVVNVKIPKGYILVGVRVPASPDFFDNTSVPVNGLVIMRHIE